MRCPRVVLLAGLAVGLALGVGCSSPPPTLTVYAAASLTDVMDALVARYETERPGRTVALSLAASSTLARQLAEAAPADVFVSADTLWASFVLAHRPDARRMALPVGNAVAVLRRTDASVPAGLGALAIPSRVALGDPAHVPAGRYAAAWLDCLGQGAALSLLPTLDTRAAVQTMRLGAADLALAYASDAHGVDDVAVHHRAKGACAPEVTYATVVMTGRAHAGAAAFARFIAAPAQADLWRRHGFTFTVGGP